MTTEIKAAADAMTDAYEYVVANGIRLIDLNSIERQQLIETSRMLKMEIEPLRASNTYLSHRIIEMSKEMDDLRRGKERLRKERDDLSLLIIQMRKRIADIMHSSIDTVNKV